MPKEIPDSLPIDHETRNVVAPRRDNIPGLDIAKHPFSEPQDQKIPNLNKRPK